MVSCEKLRGAASKFRSADVRMGKPGWSNVQSSIAEYIGYRRGTRGTETSKYPKEEKTKVISQSSGERTGNSPNLSLRTKGCGQSIK